MHKIRHFLSNIPKTPSDIATIRRWEQYIAAQDPCSLDVVHFATYLDSLALRRINNSIRGTTFLTEYSYFLKTIELYWDDLPGDARLRKISQSHLLLSTLTYEIFVYIFEPYLKKYTQEQNLSNVSVWMDLLGPLVASWQSSRQEEFARLLWDWRMDPSFTPEISARIKLAVLAIIDERLSGHFWSTYSSNNRELYFYACSVTNQFRVRALLAMNHPLNEVREVLFKHTRWDFIAGEIARNPHLNGMEAFQIYFEFRDSDSKTSHTVGGVYIDPSVHKSPITTWEF